MLNLGGCSILPAHFHPRASNYVVSIEGNTTTYMYEENGAHTITAVLTKGKATIFPAGSMHTMVNNGEYDQDALFTTPHTMSAAREHHVSTVRLIPCCLTRTPSQASLPYPQTIRSVLRIQI